jgi:hypothetical protein
MGASVGVGPGVSVGCTVVSDLPASLVTTDAVPFTGTNGLYVGKGADVAGTASQAERQINKNIKLSVKGKKRIGMGAIVPNGLIVLAAQWVKLVDPANLTSLINPDCSLLTCKSECHLPMNKRRVFFTRLLFISSLPYIS